MTHAALVNDGLFFFLVFLTLLLVIFIGAVIVAPSAPPGSPPPGEAEAPAPALDAPEPLPRRHPTAPAPEPPAPLPRRRPLSAATAADTARWSDADAPTDAPVSVYNGVRRPKVSGGPPWGPAPRPPGPDPWAAEAPAPGWHQQPQEWPVPPPARRPIRSTPLPGTPAHAGTPARHPRRRRAR